MFLLFAVENASTQSGANIVQETLNEKTHQDWCFISTVPGYYEIRNRKSGQAVHATFVPNEPNAGKNVYQWWYWGGKEQEWRLDTESAAPPAPAPAAECAGFPQNTFVHILAKHSNQALSIASDGKSVVQNPADPGTQDNWRFVPVGNGYYQVFHQESGLALSRTYLTRPQHDIGLTFILFSRWRQHSTETSGPRGSIRRLVLCWCRRRVLRRS